MLKIRLSLIISLSAASLTIIVGILSDIGVVTLASRTLISIFAFGVLGYLLGLTMERFIIKLTNQSETKGQSIDITAEEDVFSNIETPSFSPLNPDTYEKISTNK